MTLPKNDNTKLENNPISNKEFWRIKETSAYLGISIGHLYNLTSKREIPFYKKGKILYFRPLELENWILEGNTTTK